MSAAAAARALAAAAPAPADVRGLLARYGELDGAELLRAVAVDGPLRGRTALVSSFGAESAALLHMAAGLDPAFPVIFLDTLKHFPATVAYRDELAARLGLTDVRVATPDAAALGRHDPEGALHAADPDDCCHIRKTEPLERALEGLGAWVTGRKRFQGGLRADLPVIEADPADPARVKLNPLARWSPEAIEAYRERHGLPAHPLLARGYRSVGCAPCTRPAGIGADARGGRWFGIDKAECGIHLGPPAPAPERRAA